MAVLCETKQKNNKMRRMHRGSGMNCFQSCNKVQRKVVNLNKNHGAVVYCITLSVNH